MARQKRKALRFYFSYLRRYRLKLFSAIFAVFLSGYFQVKLPFIIGAAIDVIKNEASPFLGAGLFSLLHWADDRFARLIWVISLLLAAAFFFALFRILMRVLAGSIAMDIDFKMRNDYLEHLQRQSPRFFQQYRTGDLMARATNDLRAVRALTNRVLLQFISTVVTFSFGLYAMFRLSTTLTLAALSPLPAVAVLAYLFMSRIHRQSNAIQDQFGVMSTQIQEVLSGIRIIKSYVREEFAGRRFTEQAEQYKERNLRKAESDALLNASLELLLDFGVILVLLLGVRMIVSGRLTVGGLVTMLGYLAMLNWPMISIGWIVSRWQQGMAAAGRIQSILTQRPEIADDESTDYTIRHLRGEIEFRQVCFQYAEDQPPVLKNISFHLTAGKTLAVVGPTGSGKTTLVNLLVRFFDPTSGEIFIDGRPLKTIPTTVLRRAIGFVQQDAFLFSETLKENITFGMESIDSAAVEEALEKSQLNKDLDQFPQGLDTLIGERGITLSGGQKQRTAIARALLIDPSILILDDAFSSVDTNTEKEISTRLRSFFQDRTTILISHRISTVCWADQIIVLENGVITESGKHDELMTACGRYSTMAEKQQIRETLERL